MRAYDTVIPSEFKNANLNTVKRYTFWTLRIDVKKDTEEQVVDHLKKFISSSCVKGVIGQKERGKHHEHYHAVFQLGRDATQSAVAKRCLKNYNELVHPSDFCLIPSAHYFDKANFSKSQAFSYATKNECLYSFNVQVDKEKDKAKEKLNDRQARFCKDNDIDESEPQVVKYKRALEILGESEARSLYPTIHFSTNGVRVQKECINDKEIIMLDDIHKGLWITGPPGQGKSSFISLLHPGAYKKRKDTGFWESYNYMDHTTSNNHMCVHFDEVGTVEDL